MSQVKKPIERLLILGGSGYLGRAIYREFQSFYEVFGTYNTPDEFWLDHGAFFAYNSTKNGLDTILNIIRPSHVIISMWSPHKAGLDAIKGLVHWALNNNCHLTLLSHVMVFDAVDRHPSFPNHRQSSISETGKYFIQLEKLLEALPEHQYLIARLAMVIGLNSAVVRDIKTKLTKNEPIEVFPNLIVSAITRDMMVKQLHYLLNRRAYGVYHLASKDLIHHSDLITELCTLLSDQPPLLKHVFDHNEETYLALMSPEDQWPEHLCLNMDQVLQSGIMSHVASKKITVQNQE